MSDTLSPESRLAEIRAQIEKAHGMIAQLCTGERKWSMSVPARPDYDPDIIISTALRSASTLIDVQQQVIGALRGFLQNERVLSKTHVDLYEEAEQEVSALTAQLAAAQGWQPIETAPKDGSYIDVWTGDDEFPSRWTEVSWTTPSHFCLNSYCDSCPEDHGVFAWRDSTFGNVVDGITHWCNVPTPPLSPSETGRVG